MREYSIINDTNTLTLDPNDYQGGIALWGAIPAVFDTRQEGYDRGIHVHARHKNSRKKAIDKTFSTVLVKTHDQFIMIDEQSAIAFAMSALFGISMIALRCQYCENWLLDKNLSAILPRTSHHCEHCQAITLTNNPCVANPLAAIKNTMGDFESIRPTHEPDRSINLDHGCFNGGIQLWGTNPSIIWTADRLEETGIHVHAYNSDGKRIIDNTYSQVVMFGTQINNNMVRLMQVQQAIPEITPYLGCIACPRCDTWVFHRDEAAAIPSTLHACTNCQHQWQTEAVISNPVFRILKTHQEQTI